ncbi:MAG: Tad domain-containing protein [bacterium]
MKKLDSPINTPLKNPKGQVMLIALPFLLITLVFALVLINVTRATDSKVRLQTAADGAAITGAVWQARSYNQVAALNTAAEQAEHCYHIINYYCDNDAVKKTLHYVERGIIGAVGAYTRLKPIMKFALNYEEPKFTGRQASYLKIRARQFDRLSRASADIVRDFMPSEVYRTACANISNGEYTNNLLKVEKGVIKSKPGSYGALIMDDRNDFSVNSRASAWHVKNPESRNNYSSTDFTFINKAMEDQHNRRNSSYSFDEKYFTVMAWDKRAVELMGSGFFNKADKESRNYVLAGSRVYFDSEGVLGKFIGFLPSALVPSSTVKIPGVKYFYPKWKAVLAPVKTNKVQLDKFYRKTNIKELAGDYESIKEIMQH